MTRSEFEKLLDFTLMDGVLTEQEQMVLIQRANDAGISPDELQIMIDAKMQEKQISQQEKQNAANRDAMMIASLAAASRGNGGGKAQSRPTKCPHCGAPISSNETRCKQCGGEIPDDSEPVGFNINKFSEMLIASKDIDERVNVIKYAVLPNTKNSLIEFAIFANSQFKAIGEDKSLYLGKRQKIRAAWVAKANELITKASLMLKDDKPAQAQVQGAAMEIINMQKVLKSNAMKYYLLSYGAILLGFLCLFLGLSSESGTMLFSALILWIFGGLFKKPKIAERFIKL